MKTVVIGLGAMGAGMAANLHNAGQLHCAWNRSPARGQELVKRCGATVVEDLATAVSEAELVITCVSTDADLLSVCDRIKDHMPRGGILLDTSTVAAGTARTIAEQLAEAGIAFLDGPVSGGKEGADKGTMVMMVGGDAAVLERIRPVLDIITGRVEHMGPVGAGQTTKAVNQIMVAGINQAVTEALAFGQQQGLDMDKVIDLLGGGAAGSWFLKVRGPTMVHDSYAPGFRLALHHKDLKICQSMAAEMGAQLPIVEMTLVHYQRLMEQGHGDEDISALFRQKKTLFEH
jgi:3-hydroxyisobutyrate dehydrogenase